MPQDITSAQFDVGEIVNVRCTVVSTSGGVGSGSRVNLLVETPGLVGEAAGVTLSISPSQCRKAAANSQLGAVSTSQSS